MEDKTIITCVAIGAVVVIECVAMAMGMNGQYLAVALAILAGLAGVTGGYELHKRKVE